MDGSPWMVGACEDTGTAPARPATTCGEDPVLARDPDAMCAAICLDPGLWTVEVRATRQGQSSPVSNPLDLDLRSMDPCQSTPVPPPPPPPPPPSPPPWQDKLPPIPPPPIPIPDWTPTVNPLALINYGCVEAQIKGPCLCGFPPHPCITMEYFEPMYLVETVKRPGTTMLPGASHLLQHALGTLGLWGAGGAANATGQGHTNLQYTEVHVWTFPKIFGGPCTSCASREIPLALHYASELDAATWRTATAPIANPLTAVLTIGPWARLYPRGGRVIHSSEPVGSAVAVVRALDIAHQPLGTPPNVDKHIVPLPIPGMQALVSCLQMGHPRQLPCIQAGTPNALWETGTVDLHGNYAWTVWVKRSCCVDIDTAPCGIATAVIGGRGANFCPLSPPTP